MAARAKLLAEAALEEGANRMDVALLRSAAEMYALTACIGSDANAVQLIASLCNELASTPYTGRSVLHFPSHLFLRYSSHFYKWPCGHPCCKPPGDDKQSTS